MSFGPQPPSTKASINFARSRILDSPSIGRRSGGAARDLAGLAADIVVVAIVRCDGGVESRKIDVREEPEIDSILVLQSLVVFCILVFGRRQRIELVDITGAHIDHEDGALRVGRPEIANQ